MHRPLTLILITAALLLLLLLLPPLLGALLATTNVLGIAAPLEQPLLRLQQPRPQLLQHHRALLRRLHSTTSTSFHGRCSSLICPCLVHLPGQQLEQLAPPGDPAA